MPSLLPGIRLAGPLNMVTAGVHVAVVKNMEKHSPAAAIEEE